ncbi:MAG: isopentenyl phosphate kinase [Metallosphaera sp.]
MGPELGKPSRVIKLGGSVITCKSVPYCLDVQVIRQCIGELSSFAEGLVLVHGGGSFGHYEASRSNNVRITLTAASMQELNAYILREMALKGIKAFPLPGRFYSKETIETILDYGHVPVLYGDIKQNGEIVSGDDLTVLVAKEYSLTALFATDVDGVLLGNRVVNEISSPIKLDTLASKSLDITGGMQRKIEKIFQHKVDAVIFNGKKKGNVYNALHGERIGTFIKVRK